MVHVGVGHAGVGHGLCRGGVGWVMLGWGRSCRGEMGHGGVEWVMVGWVM